MEFLEDQPNEHCSLPALDQLPKGVDETYKATVSRIERKTEQVDLAIRTLKWLTFAKEHLQAGALLHALAVKDDSTDIKESDLWDIEKVISLCMGLVALDRKSSKIRLVHETTQRYFQKYFRDGGVENVHAEIAMTCLRYFSFPAFSHHFTDGESMKGHLEKYKLSSYASRFWSVHIRESRLESKLLQAIVKTFENQGPRDSVYMISEYTHHYGYVVWWELSSASRGVQFLHFASLHGLCILCRELLRQSNTMQRLYFPVREPLMFRAIFLAEKLCLKVPCRITEMKDYYGMTPLQWAARQGHADVVRLLLEKGANVNAQRLQGHGETPLYQAASNGHADVVGLLLQKGANVNALGSAPLYGAASNGHADVARLLLQKGANVNAQDQGGGAPLYGAASNGNADVVRLLLEKGANVNAQRQDGWTPLHEAALWGHAEIVSLLLEKGANVNSQRQDGGTPLHTAAWRGHADVVRLLLEKGENVNAQDQDGRTPLHKAARYGRADVVRLLLEKGAKVNAQEKDGGTPLHWAALEGHADVVRLLLEKGANGEAKDNKGFCPLAVARERMRLSTDLLSAEDLEIDHENISDVVRILEDWISGGT